MYENNGTLLLFSFQMPLLYEKQGEKRKVKRKGGRVLLLFLRLETMFARGICSIDSHICIGDVTFYLLSISLLIF